RLPEHPRENRAMNRKTVLLNVALLALTAILVWILKADWSRAQVRERALREQQLLEKPVIAPPALPPVKPIAPAQYFEVADKTLFSKDRSAAVIIDPPAAPPAPPPMPDLPNYHGQMSFGSDPIAFLSTGKIAQRSYHIGENVGEFKLIAFDQNKMD